MDIEFEIRKIINSKCHNAGSCNDCFQIAEAIIELLENENYHPDTVCSGAYYGH